MLPFIILIFLPIVIQHVHIDGIDYEKKNKFVLVLFFVILTILVALRHESVGNDTRNYIYYFEKIAQIPWSEITDVDFELGYVILNKIVSIVTLDSQFFFAVVAVVCVGCMLPTCLRLCEDSALTLVLFVTMSTFFMMFSGLRQMLAISIGFIAYEFVRKKKPIQFVITVVVAMLFHTSGIILLVLYPLYYVRITKKWLFVVLPLMAGVFVFNSFIFSFLLSLLERFTRFEGIITQTQAYTILILFVIFVVFCFVIPDEEKLDEECIGLRNILLLSTTLQMFAPLHTLAMRMNYYFIIFIPMLIPKIIKNRSSQWNQIGMIARHIMVVFFAIYFFTLANQGSASLKVLPYHFFREDVI